MNMWSFDIHAPEDFKVIWLSQRLSLNIPDADYSRSASYLLYYIGLGLVDGV